MASEKISEHVIKKNFLGGHVQDSSTCLLTRVTLAALPLNILLQPCQVTNYIVGKNCSLILLVASLICQQVYI